MKNNIILGLICLFSLHMYPQQDPVKIVFDVTSSNEAVHKSAMRHVKAMAHAYPDSQFEVVMYSGSLSMALKDKSSVAEDMQALAANNNVSFAICAVTMKAHDVTEADLVYGVKVVPDGILELARKQSEGWSYIKED
ncbi:MAG: DsrE family protein [Gillisia sp.]